MNISPTEEKQHVDSWTTESYNCNLKSGVLFKILNSLSFRIFIIIHLNCHCEYICKCCSIFKIFPSLNIKAREKNEIKKSYLHGKQSPFCFKAIHSCYSYKEKKSYKIVTLIWNVSSHTIANVPAPPLTIKPPYQIPFFMKLQKCWGKKKTHRILKLLSFRDAKLLSRTVRGYKFSEILKGEGGKKTKLWH